MQTTGTVRRATPDDLPRIRELVVAGWRPIYRQYRLIAGDRMWNDLWAGWEENWLPLDLQAWDRQTIVTELDGQVVGFATWSGGDAGLSEIGGNAVDPDFLGRGIGSAQTRWIVDLFRESGARCVKVHTGLDPAHGPARAEYRKAGLRLGVTRSVYHNYLDEVARVPIRKALGFRWAEERDAEVVRGLARDAWATVYEGVRRVVGDEIFAVAFAPGPEGRADEWARVVADSPGQVRIVAEDGRPAGFAVLDQEPAKALGVLRTVAVAREFRGRGGGCGLCMDAFALFRERGLSYARLSADLGEVSESTRRMCWNVGLYRELPSIDYYMSL